MRKAMPGTRLLATVALAVTTTGFAATPSFTAGALPPIDGATRLLVVSPHPDDETLCCAGAMQRVREAGGSVSVVWITSGDGSRLSMLMVEHSLLAPAAKVRELASKRMSEARAAAGLLGVPAGRQLFLGYPDGVIGKLLVDAGATLQPAGFTGITRVPYPEALFPGHPYTGASLERDFDAVLERVQPSLVLAPSPRDSHPDHSACGALVIRALTRRGTLARARFWIVHGGEGWPQPRGYLPAIPLAPPAGAAGKELAALELTELEEAAKLRAVRAYQTQMQIMSPFLLAFVRTNELYGPP